jgi:pyruvate dehydrogenase E2 component (dihydrolipoamide acetyltransferase)
VPIEILMPALSPTMTEGTLAKWCKSEGDAIKIGDVIAEIETDKATMEVEAMENGILGKILIPASTKGVKVNSLIAIILLKGEGESSLKEFAAKPAEMPQSSCSLKMPQEEVEATIASTKKEPEVTVTQARGTSDRIFASPLAIRIASQNQVDLSLITGSGPAGRIVKSDVMDFINTVGPRKQVITKQRKAPSRVEVQGLRRAIAAKLTEVKQNAPHFYLSIYVDVDKLLDMRVDINKDSEDNKSPKISVNDLVIKAISLAFRDMPQANIAWNGDHIEQYHNVDASVAVSVDGGIFTPIVKDADQKSVFEISKEVKSLAARAKSGELSLNEFIGGSFTVSNLGMYGIDNFIAILNPPQSCIFAIGAAKKVPVVKGDKIVIGNVMNVTISCDHRVIDGAVCAKLMNKIRSYLENPFRLLI